MTKPTHSERERFVADLIRHAPAADIWFAIRLMRCSGTYHRLTEKQKHAELTRREIVKLGRSKATIESLCRDIRCTVTFNGDSFSIVMPDNYAVEVPAI
jgi:hypothetical protein